MTGRKDGHGGVAERLIAAVLKTVGLKGSVGSNPTPAASGRRSAYEQGVRLFTASA